jgi:hypothetical protein
MEKQDQHVPGGNNLNLLASKYEQILLEIVNSTPDLREQFTELITQLGRELIKVSRTGSKSNMPPILSEFFLSEVPNIITRENVVSSINNINLFEFTLGRAFLEYCKVPVREKLGGWEGSLYGLYMGGKEITISSIIQAMINCFGFQEQYLEIAGLVAAILKRSSPEDFFKWESIPSV